MFKFSPANTKLKKLHKVKKLKNYNAMSGKKIFSLDLLAGHSCPGANECHSKVVEENGKRKLVDGKDMEFRCFSASQEVVYTGVYNLRKHNFDFMKSLKTESDITEELLKVFPKKVGILRFHVSGDVFKKEQLLAYFNLARENKNTRFYSYSKSLRLITQHLDKFPSNFNLLASKGGRYDNLISKFNLPFSQVVYSEQEAKELGLPLDDDDSHCVLGKSCSLLIHANGPAGSLQAKLHSEKRQKK